MAGPPPTRHSLLLRLRNPADNRAWDEFVEIYSTIIYSFARKRGLQDADAADVMQEVMRSVARSVGQLNYDREKGTFRGWLYSITRNKVYNHLESTRRKVRGSGDSAVQQRLESIPNEVDDHTDWDQEYEQRLFHWAAARVKQEFRTNTWEAFWQTAVEGKDSSEVGQKLGLSPGAVYVAKSRVLSRIRQEIQTLEGQP
ncbi:MAG: sigma-70 family RNA polymerase sigma factor [Zavarzinella sp.]